MIKQDKKNVFIETFGCQMNEYDSELVKSILTEDGRFTLSDDELEADVILLNTCAVREHAQRKVFALVHDIRHRRDYRPTIFGILGCIATHLQNDILDDNNAKIDLIAGPDSYKRLPELIQQAIQNKKSSDLDLSEYETYENIMPQRQAGINAWIAVMRGCNNFCTFCVVPYTRGRERSRSIESIVQEASQAASNGFPQVTLLGQNVNSYQHDGADFSDLLSAVSQVEGIQRVRFTSPHPKDFPRKLLETMASNKKICKQIHFPLQAGSDRILQLMNRTYTRDQFLELIQTMRAIIPEIVISTDIIVGFPTETDEDFTLTLETFRQVQFDSAFIFKYSERKGTTAAKKFKDDVPPEKKTERIVLLNEEQKEISLKKNQAHIGQTHTILIEKKGTNRSHLDCQGRNDGNKLVTFPDQGFSIGQCISAKIIGATPHVLKAIPVSN